MKVIRTYMPEGNAYAIIGIVNDMLRQIHGDKSAEKIKAYTEQATSGNYENLKQVSMDFVPGLIEFVDSSEVDI